MSGHGEFESPVDLRSQHFGLHRPLRWTTQTIAVASLFLLVANATALRAWVDEQPPGPVQARAAEAAAQWEGAMSALGADRLRNYFNAKWKAGKAHRFGETPDPAGPGAPDQR